MNLHTVKLKLSVDPDSLRRDLAAALREAAASVDPDTVPGEVDYLDQKWIAIPAEDAHYQTWQEEDHFLRMIPKGTRIIVAVAEDEDSPTL